MSTKTEKKIQLPIGNVITEAGNKLAPRRRRVRFYSGPETFTEQAHKNDCDINQIVERFSGDELLALQGRKPALYGDFSDPADLQKSLDIVRHANEQFDGLPSAVRKEYDNDPIRFLNAVQDPKNQKKLLELGVLKKPVKIDPPASRADIKELKEALSPPKSNPRRGAEDPKGSGDT